MDNIGIAYNADKSWSVANVTSGECYGGCGTGGMLLEALHHVKEHGGDENLMLGKLYGQEKNLTTSSIARMNLFLHSAEDFHIERGDTLRMPAFYSGDSLATFDCVIANCRVGAEVNEQERLLWQDRWMTFRMMKVRSCGAGTQRAREILNDLDFPNSQG